MKIKSIGPTLHHGEKNEGGCWENKENALGEKRDKTRKTKRLEYAQRQGKKRIEKPDERCLVQRRQAEKKDEDEGFAVEGFGIKAATSKQTDEPGIKPNYKKCICLQTLRFEVLYLIN